MFLWLQWVYIYIYYIYTLQKKWSWCSHSDPFNSWMSYCHVGLVKIKTWRHGGWKKHSRCRWFPGHPLGHRAHKEMYTTKRKDFKPRMFSWRLNLPSCRAADQLRSQTPSFCGKFYPHVSVHITWILPCLDPHMAMTQNPTIGTLK